MKRLATALVLSWLCGAAAAAPFQNGSFELGAIGACNTFDIPAGSTIITGWIVSAGNIDWESAPPCGWQASQGNNSLDLVGQGFGFGGIQQTFDTVPGTTYVVQFDLAGNYGALPVIKPLRVTINGAVSNFTFDTTGRSQFNMGWTTHTLQFTANGATSTIEFFSDVSASGGPLNAGAALDNVRITPLGASVSTAEIPLDWAHWAAMLLLTIAAAVMLGRRGGRG